MFLPPNSIATVEFQVQLGASAIALNSPVAVVLRDGVDTAVEAVITTTATGRYVVSFTVPSNWVFPQKASIRLEGVVNGISVEFTKEAGQVSEKVITSSDLSEVESNIGLLLDKSMLTPNKPVTHSPTQIVIGNDEVVIDLVIDEDNDAVTGTRTI